jgi:hypothetical protein
MSTITREFTKEQLIDRCKSQADYAQAIIDLYPDDVGAAESRRIAEIALASLEAGPVADVVAWSSPKEERTCDVRLRRHDIKPGPLYTATPAPVSVQEERYQHLSELYHAQEKRLFKLAQRIKGQSFDKYAHSPSQAIDALESALFGESTDACRAAMLQGAEPVTTAYKLRDAVEVIRNSGIEIDAEKILAERDALNSPVIPDGWVMVPVEPTEDMIVEGFESEPDESFSDEKEWEAYEAMSGCQQAAHRAKLCWAAMIAAAPEAEHK